jgi:hypothetical protein
MQWGPSSVPYHGNVERMWAGLPIQNKWAYGVAHILSENEQSPTTIKESDGVRVRPSIRLPSEGEPS